MTATASTERAALIDGFGHIWPSQTCQVSLQTYRENH